MPIAVAIRWGRSKPILQNNVTDCRHLGATLNRFTAPIITLDVYNGCMKSSRGHELAARLKASIESQAAAAERERADRAAHAARLTGERTKLFDDLLAFGEAVGHLAVSRSKKALVFGYSGRKLRLEIRGDADGVSVSGGDVAPDTVLGIQEELKRWVVITPARTGPPRQELLFDKGLAMLMAKGLGLTTPGE